MQAKRRCNVAPTSNKDVTFASIIEFEETFRKAENTNQKQSI
jgi:hypothetical protein